MSFSLVVGGLLEGAGCLLWVGDAHSKVRDAYSRVRYVTIGCGVVRAYGIAKIQCGGGLRMPRNVSISYFDSQRSIFPLQV